jgi:hypothetical protein
MKQVIVDYIPFEVSPQQINEAIKENNGKLVVKGVLQRANAKNQNGRVYPKEILMRESKKYNDNFVKQNRALGELDHPDSSVVNLQNVSHNILKELFKNGIKLGISSRGLGSVEVVRESNGDQVSKVGDDFELIAFDFVSNPSTHGAFLYPMNESVDHNQTGRTCGDYCRAEDIINHIIRGE